MQSIINWLPQKLKRRLPDLDLWVVFPYVLLSIFGIIMVYSASADYYIQNGISLKAIC